MNGRVSARFHYKPFGSAIEPGQSDDPGYTGHLYGNDLGLTYMKARYFDSDIGRFYIVDPIGFVKSSSMSFNRYLYANVVGAPVGNLSSEVIRPIQVERQEWPSEVFE